MKTLNLLINIPRKVTILMVLLSLAAAACSSSAAANQVDTPAPLVATATSSAATAIPTEAMPASMARPTAAAATMAPATQTSTPAAPATVTNSVQQVKNKKLGTLLVTHDGRTLYTFSKDTPGVSTCTDSPCEAFWPAYTLSGMPDAVPGLPGMLSEITRPDGALQLAYNNLPLYTFAQDLKPGDVNGDSLNSFGGTWHALVTAAPQAKTPKKPRRTTGGGYQPMPHPMYP